MIVNIVLGVILPLILFVVAGYLVKSYRDDNVIKWVGIAVKAAEQIFEHGENREKFNYVVSCISNKFKISETDLENIIESAVYELNQQSKDTEQKE